MDKGWGLTLDSDAIGLFMNKPPSFNLTPRFKHSKNSMFPGIDFPANPPTPSDQNRMAVNEVDFFSDKNKPSIDSKPATSIGMSVKKETSDVNTGLHLLTANTGSDQSTVDDRISSDVEDRRAKSELAMMHVELERVNEENQRLKGMLTQVTNNYGALQMHLLTLMQQQQQNLKAENTQTNEMVDEKSEELRHESGGSIVPRQFIELGPSASTRIEETSHSNSSDERTLDESTSPQDKASNRDGKAAGREDTPESESWAPNKVPKLGPSKSTTADQPTEATMRKARVSVRARSEAPMISDGCQWRKYGQKMAKGNPCPRAYYRCTMAVGCPVRKQVQRCAEDRTILITTYEGNHNHPLPPAAVAMASTTSAAANMLLSGSMPSADGLMNPNFMARAVLPCSSGMATISASAPFPTVTLDLTQTPSTPPQLQRHPTQFQVPFPPSHQTFIGQPHYNQSKFSGYQISPAAESAHFPHQSPSPDLHLSADTMRAATAAITSDPNFTAALAAAITSIMGGQRSNNTSNATNVNTTTSNTTTISTKHQQHQDQ